MARAASNALSIAGRGVADELGTQEECTDNEHDWKRLQRPMPEVSALSLRGIGALELRGQARRGMPGSAGRRLRCCSTVAQCVWAS